MAATSVSALVFLLFSSLLWIHRTNFKASNNKCSVYGQLFAEGDGSTSFCTHVFGSRLPTRLLNLAHHGFHRSLTQRSLWSPLGYNSLLVPRHDPPQDINIYIFMDITLNPGPGAPTLTLTLNLRNDSNSRRLKLLMENFGLHRMIDKPPPYCRTGIKNPTLSPLYSVHILNTFFVLQFQALVSAITIQQS